MRIQEIHQNLRQDSTTIKVEKKSITKIAVDIYLDTLNNGKNTSKILNQDEQKLQKFITEIDKIKYWQERLDSSYSKKDWLERFHSIAKKGGVKFTKQDLKDLENSIEKAARDNKHTWRKYFERGRIWS